MAIYSRERCLTRLEPSEMKNLKKDKVTSPSSLTRNSKRWSLKVYSLNISRETKEPSMEQRSQSWKGSNRTARSPSSKLMFRERLKSTDKHLKATSCSSTHPPLKNYANVLVIELKLRPSLKCASKRLFVKSSSLIIQSSSQTDWLTTPSTRQKTSSTR